MAGPEVVGFSIDVDLKALRAQLATIPGITKKEATAMVAELRTAYKSGETAAKQMADNTKKAVVSSTSAQKDAYRDVAQSARVAASEQVTQSNRAKAGLANLSQQLSDVAIQLESGTPIGRIMLQQGSQVADAVRMMGDAFLPFLRVLGPVAVAVAALGAGWYYLNGQLKEAEAALAATTAEADGLATALDKVRAAQMDRADALALAEDRVTQVQLDQRDAVAGIVAAYKDQLATREEGIRLLERDVAAVDALAAAEKAAASDGVIASDIQDDLNRKREKAATALDRERVELANLTRGRDVAITSAVLDIEATDRATRAKEDAKDATEALRKAEEALRKEKAAQKLLIEETFKADQASNAARNAVQAGIEDLNEAARASADAQLTGEARVQAALMKTIATIEAKKTALLIADAAGDTGQGESIQEAALNAEVEATADAMAQIRKIREEEARKQSEEARKAIAEQRALQKSVLTAVEDGLGQAAAGFDSLYENRAATVAKLEDQLARSEEYLTENQKAELEKRIELQQTAARRAFEISKAFKIAQAVVATYTAANEALASAPYPVNLINAGVVIGAGLVNVATISAQQPSFHRGGTVDEIPVTALRGEAFLSRQGRAAIGDDAINAANAGKTGGSGAYVYQVYGGRIWDRVSIDNIRRGGRFDGYVRKQRTAPYGHRS